MKEEKKQTENKPTAEKTAKVPIKKKSSDKNGDFKRKYFEYYDDIKISDRQDW